MNCLLIITDRFVIRLWHFEPFNVFSSEILTIKFNKKTKQTKSHFYTKVLTRHDIRQKFINH